MSTYGFDIPHLKVQPSRDIIAIQIPYPPSMVGSILIPDVSRDLGQHGVQAGIIRAMGPLAFMYKDGNGLSQKQSASIGDWVLIKWGAGTIFVAGRGVLNAIGGWRYISSFGDVIGILPAVDMPDPSTLEWMDQGVVDDITKNAPKAANAPVAYADAFLTDEERAARLGGIVGVNGAALDSKGF